jgi:ankyrin repeat protein
MLTESGRIGEIDLAHACKVECIDAVKLLLKIGPFDINGRHVNGETILSNAIIRGHDAVALNMIAHPECDPNLQDRGALAHVCKP